MPLGRIAPGPDAHVSPRPREVIDSDHFRGVRSYNLGTPDGSGDIAEGLNVEFRVCAPGIQCSDAWVYGTA
ncbi:hypothetical protein CXR04_11650 [Streptomyces sp. CMB-StM0423]|nr:hypothetical protein CXR04_11650 [Streptomyces sp. CMB-StM0423]